MKFNNKVFHSSKQCFNKFLIHLVYNSNININDINNFFFESIKMTSVYDVYDYESYYADL